MSGINERIRALCAAFDRTESPEILREIRELEFQKRKAEDDAERERQQAHKTREAEVASTNWYAAVDTRIRAHFKDWAWAAIDERTDERRRQWWEHEWGDVLKDAIGGAMGTIGREVRAEFKRAVEEQQRAFEAKLVALESWVDGRIEAALARERDVLTEATAQLRAQLRDAIGEMIDSWGTQLAALEGRVKATPGRLPVSKVWREESVSYENELVSYDGSLYQAKRDTAQIPGGSDWILVARAGRDGLSLSIRGAFDVYKKYTQLDVVTFDDASFVAKRDNPGICPGSGWQALAPRGKTGDRGPPGPRGMKGECGARGEASPTIVSWQIDAVHYRAVPTMSDGKAGAPLELRDLFQQFCNDGVIDAAVTAALKDAARG